MKTFEKFLEDLNELRCWRSMNLADQGMYRDMYMDLYGDEDSILAFEESRKNQGKYRGRSVTMINLSTCEKKIFCRITDAANYIVKLHPGKNISSARSMISNVANGRKESYLGLYRFEYMD